jgi:hypothetical protein
MTERLAPSHLRLIATRDQDHDRAAKPLPQRDKQLSFPYPEASTVFLVYIDLMGKDEFARIVGEYTPRWIIDVRAVPRLDTIAASRLSAFALFERAKASYVDLFGRLGIKSYRVAESNPAYWSSAVLDLLKNSDRKGPYLFLFDNEQLLRIADDILPEVIQPVVGKTARFAHIRHSEGVQTTSRE